jgi:phosphohistidine phosphatase SixA
MSRIILLLIIVTCYACNSSSVDYYIVRHAEKAPADTLTKSSDVSLSDKGKGRAFGLSEELKNKGIRYIFSTNTIRTKAAAEPLSKVTGIPVEIYNAGDVGFVEKLKNLKENVLIVGHANTVDDLVNELTGKALLKDLKDSQYGDLFIVHKKGDQINYEVRRFEPVD